MDELSESLAALIKPALLIGPRLVQLMLYQCYSGYTGYTGYTGALIWCAST